jgi:NAD(P)-dependent dehydrogenase (short-subunit alcohol dehydrogenase family)
VDTSGAIVIVGGSAGIGLETARFFAERGEQVVVTSRDQGRADAAAAQIGGATTGVAVDLADPASIGPALGPIGPVKHLVIGAVDRDENTVRDFDIRGATQLVVLKLVGYAEVVHALSDRLGPESSVVLLGGLAKDRPYPGSTTVTTVNGGVTAMVRTLAVEMAPVRFNALHPAIVGDTPYWADKPAAVLDGLRARTPIGRLVSTEDIVHATAFLLENRAVNGISLSIDGGWLLT